MSSDKATELIERALEDLKYQRYSLAVENARKALALQPDSAEAYNVLGIALSRSNRAPEAADALQKAIALAPDNAKGYYNLAAHYFAFGERELALAAAQKALELEPNHTPSRELISRLQSSAQTPYIPPPFARAPEQPRLTHSFRFVAGLGWAWDVMGWFLFAAFCATYLVLNLRATSLASLSSNPSDLAATMEAVRAWMTANMGLAIAMLVWFGLFSSFWIVDICDRRPPRGLVTLSVVSILLVACCPYMTVVGFPLYMVLRRQRPLV